MTDEIISSMKIKMDKTIEALKKDFVQVRTGKANPAMIEDVKVEYYGALTPISQMGTITTPEPRMIMVSPFDKGAIKNIEKGIMTSSLGLTPTNDGSVIRIVLPELTGDRRKELVKVVKQKAEEKKIAIRNLRRDSMDDLKKIEKEVPKDEFKSISEKVQKITDSYIEKIATITTEKEKEIMTV
jgi:ribosome recycling factor